MITEIVDNPLENVFKYIHQLIYGVQGQSTGLRVHHQGEASGVTALFLP